MNQRRQKHVLVLADLAKPDVADFAKSTLLPWLQSRVSQVGLEGDPRGLACGDRPEVCASAPDLAIVLGGDGAILGAVRAFADTPVPTLGINFGRVGFLASTPSAHWEEVVEEALRDAGHVEPRMRLSARVTGVGRETPPSIALNDVVLQRGMTQGMLTIGLYVDGDWVTDYRADGLIVATPSGSTAHSLSAGGPILFPSMLGVVVTPICPQGLSYRPLVLHPDHSLELRVVESSGVTTLAVDGQGFFPLRHGQGVRIERHPQAWPLLVWRDLDPYRRLRERLGWSGQITPRVSADAPQEPDLGMGGVL